jgi:two-component system, chemotaxis family, chemotaxis protein CheY
MIQKVYLIDDDQLSVYLTRFVLNQARFAETIVPYQEAKLALKALQDPASGGLPEVIFLDLNMPEMDGWAFLDALKPRQQELAGQVKIYILTSSVDPQDQEKAAGYGLVAGFLLKPLELQAATALKQELRERP